MKKQWTKPKLVIIKRNQQESVLNICKSSFTAGPNSEACSKLVGIMCCNDVGKS